MGDVPITFGYMYALFMGVVCLPGGIRQFLLGRDRTGSILAYSLFILLFLAAIAYFCGVANLGFFFSIVFGFCVLPVVFMLSLLREDTYRRTLETYLLWSIRFAVAYGVFLFVYKSATGQFIEIPYLTVNADDVGKMGTKYIQRSDISKLISTYNNGNIFGVCLLTLIPLYDLLERRPLMKALARVALILTLSRTVWAVLLIYETFLTRRPIWQRAVMLALAAVGVVLALEIMSADAGFLTDSTLGGRMSVVDQLSVTLFPIEKFNYVSEILWVSVLYFGGVIGLVIFAGLFLLIFSVLAGGGISSEYEKVSLIGVANFFLCSFVDAAANYIPTMFVFWLVVWIGLVNKGRAHV
ncbi:hypothetical protein [Burkholderia sp. 8Y]|uniref:hypothetical protein n=1 Tax=Burkholderia sp. 8Y TaxID=2653133 RepID=UPI00135C6635|nr:hypothetical protein [Burkholderia sp. 8Y]